MPTIPDTPFNKRIWQDPESRLLLWIATAAIIIQFICFKILYPYPNFMPPDSHSYIAAAESNQFVNIWAIGYSKFLRLFSSFTSSDLALTAFQYFFLQGSILYLLYTVRYLLGPSKTAFRIMFGCCVLNPLMLHISNFVSSDALFTAFSLLWFTQVLWILYAPRPRLLVLHAVVLLCAFTLRYTALFYPLISILIIMFKRLKAWMKIAGIGCIILLLGVFIGRTSYSYYQETNTWQYSPFGGWLLAADALYGYAYANPDPPESVPAKLRPLHVMVNRHMDSMRRLPQRPDANIGVYYFWDFKSPLLEYMYYTWRKDSVAPYLQRWGSMGSLYGAYGRYLVVRHPVLFARRYLWPNLIRYYAPPPQFMEVYNMQRDSVPMATARWFGWRSNKITTYFKDRHILISQYFTALFAFINLFFVMGFVAFTCLGGLRRRRQVQQKILWWMLIVWLSNMCFSVIAAPIELRYQIFPMVITLVFGIQLTTFILQEQPTALKRPLQACVPKQFSITEKK
ncbi:hypothetical protein [Chitinophaga sp. GbtcB8]|uniref:hypothetical protein n=1 Tax=Chitinophaga sp. GbtcB8 TaxID=2824753 RepID=UPI001C2F810B|nr:hypothetical protein [Chitinophaga sp. GbtcB8]